MTQLPATEQSPEEIKQQSETQESLQNNVLEKIKGGDVFKSLEEDFSSKEDAPVKKETEPRGDAKPVQDEEQEEEETKQEDEQEETQDDEEVVAKSKIQPRFDQLTAKLKAQQAEIDALKSQKNTPDDSVQRELDAMSEDSLEESLIQVRVAKQQAISDPAKLTELTKLERRIEKQIVQVPVRFSQNQVQEANKTIERLVGEGEITEANFQKVRDMAKTIYEKYPKIQKTVDGQSMAFELAVEHYKALGKVSSVKVDTQNLKGQLNNLKKKTALDTKSVKGGGDKVNLDKLRTNAMTGSMKDKERFAHNDPRFKIDAMIPDFLKG